MLLLLVHNTKNGNNNNNNINNDNYAFPIVLYTLEIVLMIQWMWKHFVILQILVFYITITDLLLHLRHLYVTDDVVGNLEGNENIGLCFQGSSVLPKDVGKIEKV